MSKLRWSKTVLAVMVILFTAFSFLLLRFFFSTLRIRELAAPAASGKINHPNRHVVLIAQELDNPYWRSIEQGTREASSKFGMDVDYIGPQRINPIEQIKLLKKSLAAKADAVLLQGLGDAQYRALIDKAARQGIPVIAVDTDEPKSKRLSYVGTNNMEAGQRMGKLISQSVQGSGRIGVIIGSELAPNQLLRLQGFRSIIAQHPQLRIVDVRSSNISRLQAAQQAEELLRLHPEISSFVGFSALDGAGIAEAAVRLHRSELSIFAFDATQETLEGIRQCKIISTIVQRPYDMGFQAISLLNNYFAGKSVQAESFTPISVLNSSGSGSVCR